MKYRLTAILLLSAAVMVSVQSCKKFNGIDNNSVIKKPYALYLADTNGMLMHTNNGERYENIFPSDGVQIRSILVNNENILFIKNNLHLSSDNGANFNYKFTNVNPVTQVQQMMLEVNSHDRIYVSSFPAIVSYSEDKGDTWQADNNWDPNNPNIPLTISSFTQTDDNVLYTFSPDNGFLYRRNDKAGPWIQIIPSNGLPGGGNFFLSSIKNTLLAADYSTGNGVYFSNDGGANWAPYLGLTGINIRSLQAPFDRYVMAGSEEEGLFLLQGSSFVASNNGLKQGTSVNGIVGKYNLYKNDADIRSIYIATTDGLYKSDDGGKNWILAKPGVLRTVY